MTSEIDTRLALLELAITGIAAGAKVSGALIEQFSEMRREIAQARGVNESEIPGFQLLSTLKESASSQQAE